MIDLKLPKYQKPTYANIGDKPEFITVVCVWWGDKYGEEYVQKLKNAVSRHLTIPHRFVCLTDHGSTPKGVENEDLLSCEFEEGWWKKVEIFHPDKFGKKERLLFLDLDVVIINSLDELVSSEGEFVIIENFGPNSKKSAYNSSCMLWTPSEKTDKIFTEFSGNVVSKLHGDQCWVWRVMQDEAKCFRKDLVESYKYQKLPNYKRSTDKTTLLVFHGKPNPHEVKDKIVKENWI